MLMHKLFSFRSDNLFFIYIINKILYFHYTFFTIDKFNKQVIFQNNSNCDNDISTFRQKILYKKKRLIIIGRWYLVIIK